MNELQPSPGFNHHPAHVPLPIGGTGGMGGLEPGGLPVIDIPGAGLKRDYAGILEYWQIVRRHKGTVVLVTILGGLGGILLTLPSPRVYQARTTIEIQSVNTDFLNMRAVNPVTDPTSSYDTDVQTQVRILQSSTLIDRVRE